MAANNYFGFTHGGTQYGTATAGAAYAGGQTGYAVAPAATAATYGTQRAAAGYDTAYQAAATQGTYAGMGAQAGTYQLAYGRTAAQPGYDANKSAYYQQAAVNAAVATAAYPPAAAQPQAPPYDPQPQPAKPAYTTQPTYAAAQNTARNAQAAKGVGSQYGGTYGGSTPSTVATVSYPVVTQSYAAAQHHHTTTAPAKTTTTNSSTYSGYEAALYSAATMYVAQQNKAAAAGGGGGASSTATTSSGGGGTHVGGGAVGAQQSQQQPWQGYKKPAHQANNRLRTKQPPKPQQLHYCEVCRISCAGPQTYREHLEGQKHKKKEASMKLTSAAANTGRSAGNSLRCELCDVTCTGNDAYAAHVRGIKHQKVVKLHTRLGKPIPSQEPKVVGGTGDKTVTGTAKISFVASGGLSTVKTPSGEADDGTGGDSGGEGGASELIEPEVQPVGQEYIEEMKGEDGKVVSFNCKLCDCRFNDPNAKEMHMKGRRHRLQYKKKVQPDLVVDAKPSLRQRKMPGGQKMQRMMDDMWARRRMHKHEMEEEERMFWEERRRGFGADMEWGGGGGGGDWWRRGGRPMPPHGPHGPHPLMPPRRESLEDRHMVARHTQIYPPDEELEAIHRTVSHTERALKALSDTLKDQANKVQQAKNNPAPIGTPAAKAAGSTAATPDSKAAATTAANVKTEKKEEEHNKDGNSKEDGRDNQLFSFLQEGEGTTRVLKGVMRVGLLAKGLLLKGDRNVRLVMLCADKPTMTLLKKVAQDLPSHLAKVTDEVKYRVEMSPAEGAINVTDGNISVMVSLTSPVMREPNDGGGSADAPKRDDKDVLPRQKCLDALASLRHAKWFQARAANLQSCVMTIRIMRDLCRRIPTWTPLTSWAMELLVEKSVSSAGQPLSPGEALRRLLEVVAGGLLLETGPGLLDPCEKEHIDAAGGLSAQMREDLTASAQQFLRQVAFKQIHKVLDMEPLPHNHWQSRKRRRSNTETEGEGKMVKTEGQEKMDTTEGNST